MHFEDINLKCQLSRKNQYQDTLLNRITLMLNIHLSRISRNFFDHILAPFAPLFVFYFAPRVIYRPATILATPGAGSAGDENIVAQMLYWLIIACSDTFFLTNK